MKGGAEARRLLLRASDGEEEASEAELKGEMAVAPADRNEGVRGDDVRAEERNGDWRTEDGDDVVEATEGERCGEEGGDRPLPLPLTAGSEAAGG